MRYVFRIFIGFMAVLFVFAAILQYNDPDPLRWMAIYLSAAAVCVLYVVERLRWHMPLIVGLIALTWAGTLAWRVWERTRFSELFAAWEMANPVVEEGREMYGLLIVACSMALLVVAVLRKRDRLRPSDQER
jgi:hypothetical protein